MNIQKKSWQCGVEPFLFFGSLSAHRIDRKPLTEVDRTFIRMNKKDLIAEIKKQRSGKRISGSEFYGPGLMADAAVKAAEEVK